MTKMYDNRLVEYNTKLVNVHKLHKIQEARPKGIKHIPKGLTCIPSTKCRSRENLINKFIASTAIRDKLQSQL